VIALSEEGGFAEYRHFGHFYHGWSIAQLGEREQGMLEMEAAHTGLGSIGRGFPQVTAGALAHGYATVGRIEEGLAVVNEALAKNRDTGTRFEEAEVLRLKGELLMMRDSGTTEQAEASLRTALDVARAQEAKWWELRSSVSLARLLRDTGRRDEARRVLAEIYDWFTEGFDTADLKDAKALLDELAT
jgi:predicted ATPase